MSLLKQIQKAATDSSVPIADLLRQCKVLAAELDAEDFAAWVDGELNGFKQGDDLPESRVFTAPSYGNFVGIGWSQVKHFPIPLGAIPEPYRNAVRSVHLRPPISALAQAVQDSSDGMLVFPWPPDL